MRRFLILAFLIVAAFGIVGCSSNSNTISSESEEASSTSAESSASSVEDDASSATSEGAVDNSSLVADEAVEEEKPAEGSLFAAAEWPVNDITADVPVPSLSASPSSVSENSTITSVEYESVPESEVAAYVEQVKAAGFTHSVSESKASTSYMYSAKNKEDYNDMTLFILSYSNDGYLSIQMSRF